MEIYYKLIVSKSQRALFMQTGNLGTDVPEVQKNQDIDLQNVYQINFFGCSLTEKYGKGRGRNETERSTCWT